MEQHATAQRKIVPLILTTIHGLGLLFAVLLGVAAYWKGFIFPFLLALIVASIVAVVSVRLWGLFRKDLAWSFIRRPWHRETRRYALQALLQWVFWLLLASALHLAIPEFAFTASELSQTRLILWGCIGLLLILSLVPNRRIRLSTNVFFAVGSLILIIELARLFWPVPAADTVVLSSPFRGEWYVAHAGRSALINNHFPLRSQRHAMDIGMPPKGGVEGRDSLTLKTHPAFGQTLYAPRAGRVVKVVNDRPDVELGETDLDQIVGNYVVIDIGEGRYILMAHLMQKSTLVEPGDEVRSGQAIARCGNSGNTSEPHLHLQVQSDADFWAEDLRTYPIGFHGVIRRGGRTKQVQGAQLRRNDVVIGTPDGQRGRP